MIVHRCTGPSKTDPYPCGVWINLYWGWLRVWPLFLIFRKPWRVKLSTCLGWWINADQGRNILLKMKDL